MPNQIALLGAVLLMGCATSEPTHGNLPTQHVVRHGESLAMISEEYYGKDNRAEGIAAILKANPEITNSQPGIRPGPLELTIPKLEKK